MNGAVKAVRRRVRRTLVRREVGRGEGGAAPSHSGPPAGVVATGEEPHEDGHTPPLGMCPNGAGGGGGTGRPEGCCVLESHLWWPLVVR